ncbi:hypothetical protein D920_00264 [Enterococcus faecalis 13-SD-W-01]|nr:hypothetical protein D920_00264 [Enterococcus faecalis 13-SD-W-01]
MTIANTSKRLPVTLNDARQRELKRNRNITKANLRSCVLP